ncbi:MAG: hypothetical protein OEZ65_14425 [Gemmatimonadota bacterium]|nr:hypothetical protein [Gemmatimonadota bacterium]MDH5760780.1 hypothetical protein [Gemmatimonadota bacterium]
MADLLRSHPVSGPLLLTTLVFVAASCAGDAPASDAAGSHDTPHAAAPATPAALPDLPPELEEVRTALERFQDPFAALREGYLSTVGCLEFPGGGMDGEMAYKPGAMGVHFLNPAYIGPVLDPLKPQVLLYEWVGDELRLNGAEWFAPVAVSPTAPTIFGRTLDGPMEGHEPILPVELHHWDLHVWLWNDNPNGLFHPTNSNVSCPPGPYTIEDHPPTMVHTD